MNNDRVPQQKDFSFVCLIQICSYCYWITEPKTRWGYYSLPLTWRGAEWATVAAPLVTRQVYVPLCAGAIVLRLRALLKASYCRMVIPSYGVTALTTPDAAAASLFLDRCLFSWLFDFPRFPAPLVPPPPRIPLTPDNDSICVLASIGTLSLSHVNVSGRSPVTTTHCMLVRSPTFKSRAKLKGVILGGTERTTKKTNRSREHSQWDKDKAIAWLEYV